MKRNIDRTTGSPFKKIMAFSLPVAISFLLQNTYSLGDTLIVSLSRGENAVTGINLTGSLSFLVLGFAQGCSAGFGIVLSQYVGAKNEQKMKQSLATSLLLSLIVGSVLTVFTLIFARSILELMQTNELFIEYSVSYVQAIFTGIIFNVLYNLGDQVMRAMGDSKTPLFILILCAILNLSLNSLLFITDLPSSWAGWATIISQGISAIVSFIVIFKKYPVLRLNKSHFKLNAKFAFKHLRVGLPMSFQFMLTALGCMIQQSAFNSLPNPDYAMAQSTGSKIDNLCSSILVGSANSIAIYCGQNYGAKQIDKIMPGLKAGLVMGLIYSTISYALSIFLCKPLGRLLLQGANESVYGYIFQYLSIQSLFYYVLFILLSYRQALQGLGRSSITVLGGFAELVMRWLVAELLAKNFGFDGAIYSNVLAWIAGAICFVIATHVVVGKLKRKQKQNQAVFVE
ncbi:MAG: polysaccharide biosynthesis C-terminal domain-containing protein [Clostridia bacterium]|nr:polysaccharide biosynthesis C-terminal domain-containing protein [Clostridia bacterium]